MMMPWTSQQRSRRHLLDISNLYRQLQAKLDHQDHQDIKDRQEDKAQQDLKDQRQEEDQTHRQDHRHHRHVHVE